MVKSKTDVANKVLVPGKLLNYDSTENYHLCLTKLGSTDGYCCMCCLIGANETCF